MGFLSCLIGCVKLIVHEFVFNLLQDLDHIEEQMAQWQR